jgi:hypothetical protein
MTRDCSGIANLIVRSFRHGKAAATQPVLAACFAQRSGETNFRVRNCRIIHLKSLDHLGLLMVFHSAIVSIAAIRHGGWDEQQAP